MGGGRLPTHPPVAPGYYLTEPCGYVQITDTQSGANLASEATLVALAAAAATPLTIPDKAQGALISVETSGVRWIDDGQPPEASYGMPVAAGQSLFYTGDFSTLRLIRQAAGAIINVSFFR